MRSRPLIDTDPGIDDAIALLAAWPDLDAITTVHGNVPEDRAARNVARLAAAAGSSLPRFGRGADRPLLRDTLPAPEHVHGADGLAARLPEADAPAGPPAHRRLTAAREIVAIGPLTNLATAVLCDRSWPLRVRRLVTMGGALSCGGNASPAAEFNWFADPEAARIVLRAGFSRLDIVPLDLGPVLPFGAAQRRRLAGLPGGRARAATTVLAAWDDGAPIYDLYAWIAHLEPDVFTWRELSVEVDATPGPSYGALVADRRRQPGSAPNCRVATGADPERFWEVVFDRFSQPR